MTSSPEGQAAPPAPAPPAAAPPNLLAALGTGGVGTLAGFLGGASASAHDLAPVIKAAEWALERGLGPLAIAAGLVFVVWKLYVAKELAEDARRTESVGFMRDQLAQTNALNVLIASIKPVLERVLDRLQHDEDLGRELKALLERLNKGGS